jgi:hypothetical protein
MGREGQFCCNIEGIELETRLTIRATNSRNLNDSFAGFIVNSVYKNGVITVQLSSIRLLNPIYITII